MRLLHLSVQHIRNIESASLDFVPGANLFVGANASGKTSLLEAIHLLGRGRSFRTAHLEQLVTRGSGELLSVGELGDDEEIRHRVGIRRYGGETEIHIDSQAVKGAVQLLGYLPLQVINPEGFQLLHQGPRFRRQFLDWGVFHVEQRFLGSWQRYTRALKQRNACLRRTRSGAGDLDAWDREFAIAATEVHGYRAEYADKLKPLAEGRIRELLGLETVELNYRAGWDTDQSLLAALHARREQDERSGFSTLGPQRADLSLRVDGIPAHEFLSRGQQKLLICALRLAQGQLLQEESGRSCVFLVDDLAAELDMQHREILMAALAALDAQLFVTATEPGLVPLDVWETQKVFHVEHGGFT